MVAEARNTDQEIVADSEDEEAVQRYDKMEENESDEEVVENPEERKKCVLEKPEEEDENTLEVVAACEKKNPLPPPHSNGNRIGETEKAETR